MELLGVIGRCRVANSFNEVRPSWPFNVKKRGQCKQATMLAWDCPTWGWTWANSGPWGLCFILENFNLSWANSGPGHTSSIHQLSSFEGTLWGTPQSRLCMIKIKNSNTKILGFVLKMVVVFLKKVVLYSIVSFNFQGKFDVATLFSFLYATYLKSVKRACSLVAKFQLRVDQHGAWSWVSHQIIKSPQKCWDQCSPRMRQSVLGSAPCSGWIFLT
jgi:hypothetical protein